ncbi:MAG: YitT family protein [Bacilli bacterium]|nr:YitT family protein [Bacilli bacterium]
MKKTQKIKKRINNYLFDHYYLKENLNHAGSLFLAILAAAIYAFGFCSFIVPYSSSELTIVTGGVGGISQNIALIMEMCGVKGIDQETYQSIFYFAVNIPILIFAFLKVGKRFSILSFVNVGLSSLFIFLFKQSDFLPQVRQALQGQTLTRAIFAGVTVGLSSALAFKGDISCGGIDIFSYYFALKKSTSVGKYTAGINFFIVLIYVILLGSGNVVGWNNALVTFLYSLVYLFSVMVVVDLINIRNKKMQIQIITNREDLSSILIANFPHGTTIINGKGGYTGTDRYIIYMIVSSMEVKSVVALLKSADKRAFISVTSLVQVYGNFFIKPVE